ncbi:uncharacterized protein EDB91DRAFT_1252803 [Suillus paluster]|uniref:uncharacterized protein n=1 Tax=Suillus paluster TaxID=48578 RepID=UPI001B8768E5|nr:uncharacterized protein EDB91DRAFT_1252803 [Suillus paluster]KAG1730149.1 hypothetical protein EDB91DRAFT_1252803 [Suillus paluster]
MWACYGDEPEDEDDIAIERPKYWSHKDKCIIEGVQTALNPVSPRSLCGKYYFAWEGDQLREQLNPREYDGWLMLTYEEDSETDDLSNIHGAASFGNITGTFKGLVAWRCFMRDENMKGAEIPNSWALFRLTPCEDTKPDNENVEDTWHESNHDITALEVQDDNGHPFMEFVYEVGEMHCSTMYLVYIGKRHVDGHPKGLSSAECSRLGMEEETKEMERAMNEEGSDEESDEGSDGGGGG